MKNTFPVILTKEEVGYTVFIPDFGINTEGKTLTDAIEMARDAIGIMGIDMEDDKKALPSPRDISEISTDATNIITLVDVDFSEYRRKNGSK